MSEPVAYIRTRDGLLAKNDGGTFGPLWAPLYAAPPQRPLLTDEEVLDAVRDCGLDWHAGYDLDERNRYEMLARAIERKVRGEE